MKKIIFGLIATVVLAFNVNAQRPNLSLTTPCPLGEHPVLSFEFNTIKLHRASTGCNKRFSICSDGEWLIDCVTDITHRSSSYNATNNTTLVIGDLSNDKKYLTLRFPIELTKLKEFSSEDFKVFGFDNDYILVDGLSIEKGDYIPTFTEKEILVKVKVK
ncbi:hypothetical protein [Flavobacterium sp.]|uniref:hypothetical protein n=1 Tax=Flavobacterium sp. TaxID=239 RepID=UPI003751E85B